MTTGPYGRLPSFPWDSLAEPAATARAHPDGPVDLSVGTPVDPVPESIQQALRSVAEIPGYPTTHGTPELREAAVAALRRRHGVVDIAPETVLPTIGSKEFVAWLPTLLGVGAGDLVVLPELAYPTYDAGARLAGAESVRADGLTALGPATPAILWLNSPSNPTGAVLPVEHLRKAVDWARERGALVVSDECYLDLGWDAEPVSVLHPEVHGGRLDGILAVHSLSKTANLASYRAGFVTGDPAVVERLLAVRKHAGMIVPRPVQEAMTVALADDQVLAVQRERYAARRTVLRAALESAGFRVDHSEAGLYLWVTRGRDAWAELSWFAERGILVAPGTFYGPRGGAHLRVALTASDERIAAAARRLVA
ncbi:succinyldiaminopimelate aminotransferase [Tamaricihabitans halophyticus]|uniref:Succinyldiaminopimelate aminotransferase n=1 Tax=Tamaricihabitans halophyticus TaxID=1262583 RepID=A0A4R2R3N6_9PSEU|nr:succinyldiaminopimelate transaminase [Tamaricihabitans halophyticus]TCP56238.1 succinyldiaminopimelate aminotransferase [Tamaricihabitans halophyticus]